MLSHLAVVLFRPKFSENVGSTARAMANMGCGELIVVAPRDFDEGRARALATAKGQDILDRMRVTQTLAEALSPFEQVLGTTARVGGWRKGLLTPETAAARSVAGLRAGGRIAVLFGPEDQGLTNDETQVCSRLVTIPTHDDATSLNLAQAVLIILYEFLKASRVPGRSASEDAAPGGCEKATDAVAGASGSDGGRSSPGGPAGSSGETPPEGDQSELAAPEVGLGRAATFAEREALFSNLRETLLAIDFLKDDNPDYWMLPVRGFVDRIRLKRSEFNLLMGLCRQIKWAVNRNATVGKNSRNPRSE